MAAVFDVRVFVDCPADIRLLRRIRRDIAERGRSVESVLDQYEATVRPMHERFVEPSRARADHVVSGLNDSGLGHLAQLLTAAAGIGGWNQHDGAVEL